MNKGLSYKLKIDFPNVIPVKRPLVELPEILDYNWFAGFVDGEGCFHVQISYSKTTTTGKSVSLQFKIAQHSCDTLLLDKLCKQLGCGNFRVDSKNQVCFITITKLSDISSKIIPLFNQYNLQRSKRLDFEYFRKVAELIKNKVHLTDKGLELVLKIKVVMNKGIG